MPRIPDVTSLGERRAPIGRAQVYEDRSDEIAAASIGNAARQLGSAVTEFADRRDDFRVAKAGAAFSTAEVSARQFQDNDWETYETRYRDSMRKTREEALKGVRLPANKAALELQFDTTIERGALGVKQQARDKEVEFGRADLTGMLDSYRNSALSSSDDAVRGQNVSGAQLAIKSAMDNGYIKPTEAENLNKRWAESYGEGVLDTLSFQKQVEMLRKPEGTPAGFLPPDRRANLLRQAENQVRIERERAEAEQRSKLIEVRQALTDQLRDGMAAAQIGLPFNVPSESVLKTAFGEREGSQKYAIAVKAAGLSGDVASLHQLPMDEIVSRVESYKPGSQSPDGLLGQVYADYPRLAKYGFQFRDSIGKGGSRKLEFYPPGESRSPFQDKSKPGIERFDASMGKADVFGDMLHFLPSADKHVGAVREDFQGSITSEQKETWLRGDYEQQVKDGLFEDKVPTFDQWLKKQGGDAFFRGYLTKQYPAEAYTQSQKSMFGKLDAYLREGADAQVGVADQVQLYGMVSNSARAIIKQRIDDPAGYLAQYAPKTQAAWQAFQGDGSEAARDAYLSAVDADRERLGLPKGDILPDSYAKSLAEEIANPKSAEQLASLMESEAQRWGDRWPDVHAQIAKDLPDMAAVIGSGIDRTAAVTLSSTAGLKDKELQAMLPSSVKWGDVQADVASTFDEVRRSFPAEGARTWSAISDSATRLAVSYMQAGASKGNAIDRAYKELIGNQYAIGEVKDVPFLIPRQFDAGDVEDEAQQIIDEFLPSFDMIAAPAGEDPARFFERATKKIREDAYWVARGDGKGLRLYLGARPTSVDYDFQQLSDMAAARRADDQESVRRLREQAMKARAGNR